MKKYLFLGIVLASSLVLVACGGDDDDVPPPPPGSPIEGLDRIEPLDTALLPRAAQVKMRPVAVSRLPVDAQLPRIDLPPLAEAKMTGAASDKGTALQIGVGREVAATASPDDLGRKLHWYHRVDGTQVAALAFAAEGAAGLRLGLRAAQLPAGTVLRFHGTPGSEVIEWSGDELAVRDQSSPDAGLRSDDAAMVWGPDVVGNVATLEVQLPADTDPAGLRLAVPQLSHLWQTPRQAIDGMHKATEIGAAGSCNIDAMCTAFDAESRSVAKMVFTRAGSTFLCTGTLMNDVRGSQTPYFLTAAHCIDNQSSASSLITYWFFRSASCGSSPRYDADFVRLTRGARLLVTDSTHDASLLELNDALPANVVYAGSYFGSGMKVGMDVLGIHHPQGDLQKASYGTLGGYANCRDNGSCTLSETDGSALPMFRVDWYRGTTEGGSSGSALFTHINNARYVVGTLHGGNASCQNPGGLDIYGRFERAFAAGIGNWLAPR